MWRNDGMEGPRGHGFAPGPALRDAWRVHRIGAARAGGLRTKPSGHPQSSSFSLYAGFTPRCNPNTDPEIVFVSVSL